MKTFAKDLITCSVFSTVLTLLYTIYKCNKFIVAEIHLQVCSRVKWKKKKKRYLAILVIATTSVGEQIPLNSTKISSGGTIHHIRLERFSS